jgi:hypothetical protein
MAKAKQGKTLEDYAKVHTIDASTPKGQAEIVAAGICPFWFDLPQATRNDILDGIVAEAAEHERVYGPIIRGIGEAMARTVERMGYEAITKGETWKP